MYYRLSRSFTHNNIYPIKQNPYELNLDPEKDWYLSLYVYSEDHKDQFKKTKSFKGMTGVTTDKIFFDFDSKDDLDQAREDTKEIVDKLLQWGISEDDIQICFSGCKGFSVSIKTDKKFTPEDLKTLSYNMAGYLDTYDGTVYDAQRVIRMIGTKHQKSGLYKIPLELEELYELSIDEIKKEANDYKKVKQRLEEFSWDTVKLPEKLYELRKPKKVEKKERVEVEEIEGIKFGDKPKWLPSCKFVIQEGHFEEGHRREAILILAATYKAQGFPFEVVYRMLKGVAEKQAQVNGSERLDDEEVYRAAAEVFSDGWKGGQFTCKSHNLLKKICEGLGSHACRYDDSVAHKPITLYDIKDSFKEYVTNIDQNTIVTGLPTLDENVFLSTGANVAILGSAGSGKTSLALNVLNNTSKMGVKTVFGSFDMHHNRMFEKVMYKISGLDRKQLYQTFKDNKEGRLLEKLKQEFGNVNFYNRSCPSVSHIRDYIIRCQDDSGEKVKLVMLDYFERVMSEFSDETQGSKRVAGELQDLVNDLDVALITLVQPNKLGLGGGVDNPLYDFTAIKGSSFLYQSFRIILSLWRPFYNPKDFSKDHYMQMAILKNDLGELNEFAFSWNGPKGEIGELSRQEENEFYRLLEEKEMKKNEEDKW